MQTFADPWLERWIVPNPFILALAPVLRNVGVDLGDFSFNKDAANVGGTYLSITIRKLDAAIRIGLDTVAFVVRNPHWEIAPVLVQAFDRASSGIRDVVRCSPKSQETTLAFHVSPGAADFTKATACLVNKDALGEYLFYGVSLYRSDGALVVDKSLKHEGAAFLRLQRRFAGDVPFAEIASRIYRDEVTALRLLGIPSIPDTMELCR